MENITLHANHPGNFAFGLDDLDARNLHVLATTIADGEPVCFICHPVSGFWFYDRESFEAEVMSWQVIDDEDKETLEDRLEDLEPDGYGEIETLKELGLFILKGYDVEDLEEEAYAACFAEFDDNAGQSHRFYKTIKDAQRFALLEAVSFLSTLSQDDDEDDAVESLLRWSINMYKVEREKESEEDEEEEFTYYYEIIHGHGDVGTELDLIGFEEPDRYIEGGWIYVYDRQEGKYMTDEEAWNSKRRRKEIAATGF